MPVTTVKVPPGPSSSGRPLGGPTTLTFDMAQCDPSIQDCSLQASVILDPLRRSLVVEAEPSASPILPPPFSFAESTNGGAAGQGTSTMTYVLAGTAIAAAVGVAWYIWRR